MQTLSQGRILATASHCFCFVQVVQQLLWPDPQPCMPAAAPAAAAVHEAATLLPVSNAQQQLPAATPQLDAASSNSVGMQLQLEAQMLVSPPPETAALPAGGFSPRNWLGPVRDAMLRQQQQASTGLQPLLHLQQQQRSAAAPPPETPAAPPPPPPPRPVAGPPAVRQQAPRADAPPPLLSLPPQPQPRRAAAGGRRGASNSSGASGSSHWQAMQAAAAAAGGAPGAVVPAVVRSWVVELCGLTQQLATSNGRDIVACAQQVLCRLCGSGRVWDLADAAHGSQELRAISAAFAQLSQALLRLVQLPPAGTFRECVRKLYTDEWLLQLIRVSATTRLRQACVVRMCCPASHWAPPTVMQSCVHS